MINNTLYTQKFVARKARKFALQGHRLALPALEMAYLFLGITHAPRSVIVNKMLPEVDGLLSRLDGAEYRESEAGGGKGKGKGKWKSDKDIEKVYGGGKGGYWDDYCLAMFLRGVCLRYLAYPVSFFCSLCFVALLLVLSLHSTAGVVYPGFSFSFSCSCTRHA